MYFYIYSIISNKTLSAQKNDYKRQIHQIMSLFVIGLK